MHLMKEQLAQLNKMSRKSVALYHRFALSIGVSDSSLGVLYALLAAEAPCSQFDLCGEWHIPKQTINTTVAALQKRGFVALSPIPSSRNKKSISLTDAGRAFAEGVIGQLRAAELSALAALTPEERALYIQLNQKYNQSLGEKLNGILADSEQAPNRRPNDRGDKRT